MSPTFPDPKPETIDCLWCEFTVRRRRSLNARREGMATHMVDVHGGFLTEIRVEGGLAEYTVEFTGPLRNVTRSP